MGIVLYRIDDRLIHGQVVVGWGQPLDIGFIVLVDDNVATCDWEQDLYRMGVPPEMDIVFATVDEAVRDHDSMTTDSRHGILVTPDIETMSRFVERVGGVREVNVGGIHHRAGRIQKMRYVFLAPPEESQLRALIESGVRVMAQDVPTARPVPMADVLGARPEGDNP
jgi:PTS system mannose-specific IIB component/fructoselysine and glucoselysine-specific PTS system IIB component